MALNKNILKASIKGAFLEGLGITPTEEQTSKIDALAGSLSDAIDSYVKGATVTVSAGIVVQVNTATGTGATTSTGTGGLT